MMLVTEILIFVIQILIFWIKKTRNWITKTSRNTLANLDFVNYYTVEKFDNSKIIYKVYYSSSPNRFLKDISNYDIIVDTTSPNWKVK